MTYKGDVGPQEAWNMLGEDAKAVLVDVRTRAEWSFVGLPDISTLGKTLVLVEWQGFPDSCPNAEFASQLESQGLGADDVLLFLCRSGGRSAAAAHLMTAQGFNQCYNVAGGFEGDLDESHHRGARGGWKADGLPWTQS